VDLASAIVIARDPTGFGDEEARLARLELIDEIRRLEVLVMRAWRLHTATSWPLVARRYGGSEAFVREAQAVWEKEIPARFPALVTATKTDDRAPASITDEARTYEQLSRGE
jgi:hypothetical protein